MTYTNSPETFGVTLDDREPPISANEAPMRELVRLWQVLLSNSRFILTCAFVIAIVLFNIVLLVPAKYHGVATILIDPLGLKVVEKDLTQRSQTSDSQFAVVESQMRVMTSDEVLRPVITKLNLDKDREFGRGPTLFGIELADIVEGTLGIEKQAPELKALRRLWNAVWTSRDKGSYVVDLQVSTKDPEKSAMIANEIANTYVREEFAARARFARRASGELMGQLDQLREKLRTAEDRVEKYKAAHNIIDAEGRLVNEQGLAELNKELSAARAELSRTQSRYDQVKRLLESNASPGAIAEAVRSDTIKELRVRYAAARQAEGSLISQLKPAHPEVVRARARVETVRAEIAAELSRIADSARIDYERAQANESELVAKVNTLKQTAITTNEAQVKMRELKRDAEASKLVYNSFLVRARELGQQQSVDSNQARIISPAIPPNKPAGPSLVMWMVLCAFAGLGLSTLYVLARDAVRDDSRQMD